MIAGTAAIVPHCSCAICVSVSPSLTVYRFSFSLDALAAAALGAEGDAGCGDACATDASDPATAGIRYIRPTMILFGSALSCGLTAMIASRLILGVAPRNFAAIFETLSFSTATYCFNPAGIFCRALIVALFEPPTF